jgi:magnesium-transporting ATPase (P-type)
MASVITGINPTAPLRTEAEAEAAAKASAISIFIGVIVALASIAWSLANPAAVQDAVASAAGSDPDAQAAAAVGAQFAIYLSGGLAVVQLIFGIIQWRNPGKWIAILFLVLLAYGILSTAATPLLAGSIPNMPEIPTWQIALSLVIMVIQVVLHVAGLRGINKLDQLQMEAAR